MTKNELYSHAAGILDVRGSILLTKNPTLLHKHPKVMLKTMANKLEVLKQLKNRFGGCLTIAEKNPIRYEWNLQSELALKFLESVMPFMVNIKKKKMAKYILNYRKLKYTKDLETWSRFEQNYEILIKEYKSDN